MQPPSHPSAYFRDTIVAGSFIGQGWGGNQMREGAKVADDRAPTTVQAVPRRIRAARELRGWTQREVVHQMADPISPAALSQIEGGRTRPSETTLNQLAAVLDVPVGFFEAQWPTTGAANEEPITFFRDLRSTSARERRRASAHALLIADLLTAIQLHVRIPDLDLPHYPVAESGTLQDVEHAAQRSRFPCGNSVTSRFPTSCGSLSDTEFSSPD